MASLASTQLSATYSTRGSEQLFDVEPGYATVGVKLKNTAEQQHNAPAADKAPTEITYAKVNKVRRNKQTGEVNSRRPAGGNTSEEANKKCLARADTLIRSGNNQGAIEHLEAALNDSSDARLQKQIWRLLGNCHSSTHNYKKASVAYLHYLAMCREHGDFQGATRAYCCLGISYMHQGLFNLAGNCFLQHLDNSRIMNNKIAMSSAYNNLGVLAKLVGKKGIDHAYRTGNMTAMNSVTSQLHKAISYFTDHLQLVEQLYDRGKQCAVFGNLGSCHEMLMEYPQAIHYHYQRLVLAHRLRDYRGESRALCNIGNCLRAQGQLEEACAYYVKDIQVCRLIRDEHGEGVALLNLAVTSEALGDLHKSIEWHSLLLSFKMRRNDRPGQLKSLMLLGGLYYETNQLMKAKEYFTRVVDMSQSLRDHELQVKSVFILEEIHRAIKRQKRTKYNTVRSTLRRFKKGAFRLVHTRHGLGQQAEMIHASNPLLSQLGGSGDTPMIKPRDQKDRVKLGQWSPGLKRWVNEGGCTDLHGDGSAMRWAPSPIVMNNAVVASSLDDITCDDERTDSHFSLRDSVHGYLNDNKQLTYQLEDVLMSAAAKTTSDEGLKLQRASSTMSLYSRAFGGWRHIQELRVIGQDMCQPAVDLGLSRGGEEWKEWVLSPNDDKRSVRSLSIDESMFDPQSTAMQQTTVHLEQQQPRPPHQDQLQSETNPDQPRPLLQQPIPVSNEQQPHPPNQTSQDGDSRRPVSPINAVDGVQAVISCLEAVLENEDYSDHDS